MAPSMIANFAWVPYYPVCGIIVLALDGAVIWALTVDTREQVWRLACRLAGSWAAGTTTELVSTFGSAHSA